ncbi:MAG: glycosyltransferase involved in cell wall biosynthesis [Sediminicola sp.]|jgi:glycosyltransferase involved in cell wall biosynthesis
MELTFDIKQTKPIEFINELKFSDDLKIAYLSDSELPSKRANSVHVMHMCNAFRELGHEVTLFGLKGDHATFEEIMSWYGVSGFDVELTSLRIPKLTLWIHAKNMLRAVKKMQPDLIFGRSLFGCYLLAKNGYQVCLETHDPINTLTKQQVKIFNWLLKSPNLIGLVVISQALKKIILSQTTRITEDRILVAHDGATLEKNNIEALESYAWPTLVDGRLQIGYVGTISKGRGIELIISLAEKFEGLDFHIIGGTKEDLLGIGLQEVGELRNVFFHGFVSPKEAALARKKCDILLAPYQEDVLLRSGKNTAKYMSPLKVFEYMEAGKAIIASNLPVLREVLVDMENSVLCRPELTSEWEEALENFTNDDSLRLRIGSNAYQSLIENYTWKKRAELILAFVNQQLEKQ